MCVCVFLLSYLVYKYAFIVTFYPTIQLSNYHLPENVIFISYGITIKTNYSNNIVYLHMNQQFFFLVIISKFYILQQIVAGDLVSKTKIWQQKYIYALNVTKLTVKNMI